MWSSIYTFVLLLCCKTLLACNRFQLRSDSQPNLGVFSVLSELDISSTGRPSFKSETSGLYLFHYAQEADGSGRWLVGDLLHQDNAVAYINSWAVHPMLLNATQDESMYGAEEDRGWQILSNKGIIDWVQDPTMELVCMDSAARERDSIVFLDVESGVTSLSGFFVQVQKSLDNVSHNAPIYVKVGGDRKTSTMMYRFQPNAEESGNWIIGANKGTDIGFAFISEDADKVAADFPSTWKFNIDLKWIEGSARIIQSRYSNEIFREIRAHRQNVSAPAPQTMLTMHNGVQVPTVGLGTGGLQSPERSISAALSSGYRMLDLAREYRNEHLVQKIFLTKNSNATSIPKRQEVFLLTKVWPTELGFSPTLKAIQKSLFDLRTSYIDAYLLHWPSCNPNIKWMHCQDAVEADATWHASWRALEKAYAEGAVMSIGVSNFNEQLMQEVIAHGIVRPHLVQNHADMENLDLYVRELCQRYGILFMPYAFQRNYRHLSGRTVRLLEDVAAAHGKTPRDVILRFFVQTGAVIIPRSDDPEHLAHNLDASFGWSLSGVEMASLGWPSDLSAWLESQSEGQHEL